MRISLIALFVCFNAYAHAQNWNLVWSDEFNGSSLNAADWNYDLGTGSQYGLGGWGNNELQYYEADNVTVGGGMLTITAEQESVGGMNYTSGKIHTKTKQTFQSGKIEARMKVPVDQGMWPAFWMLTDPGNLTDNSGGWPPEIDIFESVGYAPSTAHGTIHAGTWPDVVSYGGSHILSGETLADDFHVYAIEWYTDNIVWTIDGIVFHEANRCDIHPTPWTFNDPEWFIIFNLAVGGNWPGSPDGTTQFPAEMQVDYLRVYDYDVADLTDVTFRVDMSDVAMAGGDIVYVNGTWNEWCGTCNPMVDTGNDIWEVTLPIEVGVHEFKYTTNGFAGEVEAFTPGDPCTITTDGFTNRKVNVQFEDIDTGLVCFDSCSLCPGFVPNNCDDSAATNYNPAATFNDGSCLYDVTFEVNMNCPEAPASFTTPAIEGPEFGWCGSCVNMSDGDGDGIWTITLNRPVGDFEYKYAVDNWADQENLVDDWNAGNGSCVGISDGSTFANRIVSVPDDGLLFQDTYGSCSSCAVVTAGCMDALACNYSSAALTDDGSCVYATGCDTCSGATDGTGVVIDNPEVGQACDDGNASTANDTTQADCSCAGDLIGCTDAAANNYNAAAVSDDGSCMYDVLFEVDMNCPTAPAGFTAPAIEGPSFGWCGSCVSMTDGDGDGIFNITISLPAGFFEYKYAVDTWADQEDLIDDALAGSDCVEITDFATYANRGVTIPGDGLSFFNYYGSCSACILPDQDVTFRVDMSNETISPDGIHISGNWNGFSPTATPMVALGLGMYEATVSVPEGSTITWNYINGNTLGAAEVLTGVCTLGGVRQHVVAGSSETLALACFASCDPCAGCTDPFYTEYSPLATTDDGSCATLLVWGCTYSNADNYNSIATTEDGSCTFSMAPVDCAEDLDGDGAVGTSDLLTVLAAFGSNCP